MEGEDNLQRGLSISGKIVRSSIPAAFLISYALGKSLLSIWGLINVCQILMLIPLMNINLPSNAQTVFKYLQIFLSFELISTDKVPFYNQIFEFRPDL